MGKNVLEDLKVGVLEFEMVGNFRRNKDNEGIYTEVQISSKR